MKERFIKSTIVQMIGYLTTYGTFMGFQPVAVGFFIAVWCSRLIRFPLYPIIVVGMFLSSGLLSGAKYALVLFAIMVVFYIMEENKSRVPILKGAFLGGGILYAMELSDMYMSGTKDEMFLLATASVVLAISLSIVFYKIIEIVQMPRGRSRKIQEKEEYRERLRTYEERVNSISDVFAKMAKNIEQSTDVSGEFTEYNYGVQVEDAQEKSCPGCMMLKRQNQIFKSKLLNSRRIIATQLLEMSKVLTDGFSETYDLKGISKDELDMLSSRLRDAGIVLQKAVRLVNRRGIHEIIVTMKAKRGMCVGLREAARIMSLVFDKDLELVKDKRRLVERDMTTYRFRERPNFFALHGLAKAGNDLVSGDNFSFVKLDTGQTLLGISDGMGTGIKAYKDSEMVLELIENLMESGFGEEAALNLVNTLFLLDGENAAPATVDMGIIDMYSGVCDFVKLGAASTYVKRGDWVETLRSTSLPIGTDEGADIESAKKKLYDGDFVIMMSDGIVEMAAKQKKEDMISRIILETKEAKPQDMAESILNRAIELFGGKKEDDMTVFVTGVWNHGSFAS